MKVFDLDTGNIEYVVESTSNSHLVTRTKLKDGGINCRGWFTQKEFDKKFKILDDTDKIIYL